MKTSRIILMLAIAGLYGISFSSCKKDPGNDTTSVIPNNELAVAQDNESQDAVAENVNQSVDNKVDAVETNNFSSLKAGMSDGIDVQVNHPDTTTFPKVITLTFNVDTTVNGEHMSQTGQINILVELTSAQKPWRRYLKRTITFPEVNPFTVTSDSSIVVITGSHVMTRQKYEVSKTTDKTHLDVLDSINSNLKFAITNGSFIGSFTRVAKRTREAIVHFEKGLVFWRQTFRLDSLTYKGAISGVNLKGENYSRTITTPVLFTFCPVVPYNPIISQGVIALVNGSNDATITYTATGCKTTATLTSNGKTKEITRKINRKFRRWW